MPQNPSLQLRTHVREDAVLELSLAEVETPDPKPDQILIRVEAAPINPSDMGLLFAAADMSRAEAGGTPDRPVVTAKLTPAIMSAMAGRVGQSLPAGNEGAGVVVEAGAAPEAQALVGKTVSLRGGGMYAQYRLARASEVLPMPEGITPAQAASAYVNPLTVLGMVETMRLEGHTALIHTAAASNLGQMLQRVCVADGIPLVNIVRKPEQEKILRDLGATHVVNSSSPTFMDDLVDACSETGATLGFDAIGGGRIAGQILTAIEQAALRKATSYSRYGSSVHKQVYIYGGLDRGPTEFVRAFGLSWGLGGWLLPNFLERVGPEVAQRLNQRVANEITTTFASHYAKTISLPEMLSLKEIAVYGKQATGEKYLVNPNK
ncbi:MAG: zinc-binding dehydrogenase [Dehalococcoidia bacterium]|nr:zinc-binding dehydrogenase [Dehalococcoidia bacterium]